MKKLALIAGSGDLPLEFVKSVKKQSKNLVVFALKDMASLELNKEADKIYWLDIGEYTKFVFLLLKERIKQVVLLGKVSKNVIYKTDKYEKKAKQAISSLHNKKDYSILKQITKHFARIGIEVVDGIDFLSHLLVEKGILGNENIDKKIEEDIIFGYEIAKKIADLDIGQTIIVKDKSVVAVEAMEGTDNTIERAREIAGESCVMIKVSRSNQDLRWDVPTIGLDTMKKLVENQYKAIAIESKKMFILNKEEVISLAKEKGVIIRIL